MSLKSKIEAVIYASEEPVTLAQLTGALAGEAQAELDALAALQSELALQPETPDRSADAVSEAPGELQGDTSSDSGEVKESSHEPGPSDDTALQSENDPAEGDGGAPQQVDQDASVAAPDDIGSETEKRIARDREKKVRDYLRSMIDGLIREYAESDRGIEIREVAGGFRMATKPEYHDAVRGFVRSLKPALKLSLQALETLAVVAYKQPVTAAEISEIRGVDSAGVLGGLLTRKLIQTAGRKQVIGRPMLYKTSKEFLVRFGLKDIHELPSMEEFERMAGELNEQEDLPIEPADAVIERANARGDAEHIQQETQTAVEDDVASTGEAVEAASPRAEAGPSVPNMIEAAESPASPDTVEDSPLEKGPGA